MFSEPVGLVCAATVALTHNTETIVWWEVRVDRAGQGRGAGSEGQIKQRGQVREWGPRAY